MAYRLKPPRIGGPAYLRDYIHDIGFERACKVIHVHPTTMRRWLREETPVPQAALQALYWLTDWGFKDAFSESHWAHQANTNRVHALQAKLARFEFQAPAEPAANDPVFAGLHLVPAQKSPHGAGSKVALNVIEA